MPLRACKGNTILPYPPDEWRRRKEQYLQCRCYHCQCPWPRDYRLQGAPSTPRPCPRGGGSPHPPLLSLPQSQGSLALLSCSEFISLFICRRIFKPGISGFQTLQGPTDPRAFLRACLLRQAKGPGAHPKYKGVFLKPTSI